MNAKADYLKRVVDGYVKRINENMAVTLDGTDVRYLADILALLEEKRQEKPTPNDIERIGELVETDGTEADICAWGRIGAILTEHAALKAEVVMLRDELDKTCDAWWVQRDLKEKAEAELAADKPLIEAVESYQRAQDGHYTSTFKVRPVAQYEEEVLRAALALRQKKEKK